MCFFQKNSKKDKFKFHHLLSVEIGSPSNQVAIQEKASFESNISSNGKNKPSSLNYFFQRVDNYGKNIRI